METEAIEIIELELKYCERCGGLWLRRKGMTSAYCYTCEPLMAEFPRSTYKSHKPSSLTDLKAVSAECGICCAEGHA